MSDVKLPTKITGDRWNDVQGRTEAGSGCWDQPIGKFCGTIKCAAVRPLTSKYRAMGEITIQNSWTGNQYMLSRKWLTSVRIPLFTTVAVATSPMQLNNHTQRDAFRHIWTVRYRTPYEQQTLKRDCDDTFFDVNWQKKKKKNCFWGSQHEARRLLWRKYVYNWSFLMCSWSPLLLFLSLVHYRCNIVPKKKSPHCRAHSFWYSSSTASLHTLLIL